MDKITPLLTNLDAAEVLRISTRRLARLALAGQIPHVRLPDGQIRYNAKALAEWISRQAVPSRDGGHCHEA